MNVSLKMDMKVNVDAGLTCFGGKKMCKLGVNKGLHEMVVVASVTCGTET